jgi:hypothetical protein
VAGDHPEAVTAPRLASHVPFWHFRINSCALEDNGQGVGRAAAAPVGRESAKGRKAERICPPELSG